MLYFVIMSIFFMCTIISFCFSSFKKLEKVEVEVEVNTPDRNKDDSTLSTPSSDPPK